MDAALLCYLDIWLMSTVQACCTTLLVRHLDNVYSAWMLHTC